MTVPVSTPIPRVRNEGNTQSFFAAQQVRPTGNPLIASQTDATSPQIPGLKLISDPIQASDNSSSYVKNFDPALYDLRDTSHLMRLIRALCGPSGAGGPRKQNLIARLSSMLNDGAFLDLDAFYGEVFNLQRHETENFPTNLDGTVVNPYTDLANSDLWDEVLSRDARYRSRLFQLARAVNLGATYPGMKAIAEAVLNCDVDIVESWVLTDFVNGQGGLAPSPANVGGNTFYTLQHRFVTYGKMKRISYGVLQGTRFGSTTFPLGNRGELVFTPSRVISDEERYQLTHVLDTLKPSHAQVTIASETVEWYSPVTPRGLASDSENWQIQARVTPALDLVQPATPIYNNAGPYSQARPVFSEYTGEQWSYNPNVVRVTSYKVAGSSRVPGVDNEAVTYSDNYVHTYDAADGLRDVRQSIAARLSGEGVVTAMPYIGPRVNNATDRITY